VPLVEERRAAPGALEHLGATMNVQVRNHGRLVWEGTSRLAGLEHGGLERAATEARRTDQTHLKTTGPVSKRKPSWVSVPLRPPGTSRDSRSVTL
jgi:hypothetical protein